MNTAFPVMNAMNNAFPVLNDRVPVMLATQAEREAVMSTASKVPFHGRDNHITVYRTLDGWRSIQAEHPWPAFNIWDFLEAKARDLKITHPGGHYLSDEEVAAYRRDGVTAERVRAVLYGDLDCPQEDCRGRCKIEDESSQVHEIQTRSMTGCQSLPAAPLSVHETPSTMVEQASQNRRTSTPSNSSPTQLPTAATAEVSAEIDFEAISRAKKKAFQEKVAQKIAEQARMWEMERQIQEQENVEAST